MQYYLGHPQGLQGSVSTCWLRASADHRCPAEGSAISNAFHAILRPSPVSATRLQIVFRDLPRDGVRASGPRRKRVGRTLMYQIRIFSRRLQSCTVGVFAEPAGATAYRVWSSCRLGPGGKRRSHPGVKYRKRTEGLRAACRLCSLLHYRADLEAVKRLL